jgi:hypothetical protein
MSTPLYDAYDAFFIKAGRNYLYKEDQVFQFFKTGVSKSKKTVPYDLTYTIDEDNMVITVYNIAESNGDIQITINSETYTASLLTTDSKVDIINKIKTAIQADWTIDVSYITNPRIKITKIDVNVINVEIIDIDDTNVFIISNRTYDGEFTGNVEQDALELIALNMLLEQKRQRKSELDYTKTHLGTKDFNKLPDKVAEYNILNNSIKNLREEIEDFRQEFYSYVNS